LTEHEACEKLFREIMEQLTLRSREQKTSQAYAHLSSAIRLRMKQYSSEVQQLKDKLSQASASHSMYPYKIKKTSISLFFNQKSLIYDKSSHFVQFFKFFYQLF
jgi:hypothetical protein